MRNTHSTHSVNSQILRISVQTILAATLGLAITLPLSCSDNKDDGGDQNGGIVAGISSSSGSSSSGGGGSSSGTSSSSGIATSSSSLSSSSSKAIVPVVPVYGEPITDVRDGKTYETVVIGTQTWMAKNLNYDAGTDGSRCYRDDPANCDTYGRLYDWDAAMTACPDGWHLPSNAEWNMLEDFVASDVGFVAIDAGGTKLKAKSGWNSGGNGEDTYGFSALPGGAISSGGGFAVGYYGNWWSATESSASNAYYRYMGNGSTHVGSDSSNKASLYSLRCVQD